MSWELSYGDAVGTKAKLRRAAGVCVCVCVFINMCIFPSRKKLFCGVRVSGVTAGTKQHLMNV